MRVIWICVGWRWCDAIVVDVITSFVTNLTIRIVGTSFVNKPLNIGQSFNRYCFLETMPNKNVDRERRLEVIRQVYNVAYNVWSCHLYLARHWPSFKFVWWVELKTALYHTRLSVFVVTILLWRLWKNYYSNYYYSFFSEMFWGWIHPSDAINIEGFDNHSHALYLTLKVA